MIIYVTPQETREEVIRKIEEFLKSGESRADSIAWLDSNGGTMKGEPGGPIPYRKAYFYIGDLSSMLSLDEKSRFMGANVFYEEVGKEKIPLTIFLYGDLSQILDEIDRIGTEMGIIPTKEEAKNGDYWRYSLLHEKIGITGETLRRFRG